MTPTILQMAEDWEMKYPPVISDHKLVTVKIAHTDAPHLGKGRWSIPQHITNDRSFLKEIEKKGKEILTSVKEIDDGLCQRTPDDNAQKLWEEWKSFSIDCARNKAKKKTTYLDKLGRTIEKEIKRRNNDGTEETAEKSQSIAELEQKQTEIESEKTLTRKTQSNVQFRLEGETVSNYWIRMNKKTKPRDTFKKLRKPVTCDNPTIQLYET
jgi:hypothetical protein